MSQPPPLPPPRASTSPPSITSLVRLVTETFVEKHVEPLQRVIATLCRHVAVLERLPPLAGLVLDRLPQEHRFARPEGLEALGEAAPPDDVAEDGRPLTFKEREDAWRRREHAKLVELRNHLVTITDADRAALSANENKLVSVQRLLNDMEKATGLGKRAAPDPPRAPSAGPSSRSSSSSAGPSSRATAASRRASSSHVAFAGSSSSLPLPPPASSLPLPPASVSSSLSATEVLSPASSVSSSSSAPQPPPASLSGWPSSSSIAAAAEEQTRVLTAASASMEHLFGLHPAKRARGAPRKMIIRDTVAHGNPVTGNHSLEQTFTFADDPKREEHKMRIVYRAHRIVAIVHAPLEAYDPAVDRYPLEDDDEGDDDVSSAASSVPTSDVSSAPPRRRRGQPRPPSPSDDDEEVELVDDEAPPEARGPTRRSQGRPSSPSPGASRAAPSAPLSPARPAASAAAPAPPPPPQ